ncbi:hypothetical protein [Ruminococcus sp. zg-924]|uniref:vWA domain-containing protein n=1 Tax=Ruminococcus sp. zg-924 TaxID=2678505 RepID=UPI00210DF3DB|nr:hypothetical protein [Ruminococcus sp. zg-924]MCQ4022822.1 hypothetical protein [Ruminococcus sp. zg-924]
MPNMNETFLAKIVQPIVFVINTSGSMVGSKCGYLNEAMDKAIRYINELFNDSDYSANVSVLLYNVKTQWIPEQQMISSEDFEWIDVQCGGASYMGTAMIELEKNLNKNNLLFGMDSGFFYPIIIWITSMTCSDFDYDSFTYGLSRLKNNHFFNSSRKIGIAYSDDGNVNEVSNNLSNNLGLDSIICIKDDLIYPAIKKALDVALDLKSWQDGTLINKDKINLVNKMFLGKDN